MGVIRVLCTVKRCMRHGSQDDGDISLNGADVRSVRGNELNVSSSEIRMSDRV